LDKKQNSRQKKNARKIVRIINGRFHQGDIMSNAAGFQCATIALIAIILIACNRVPSLQMWSADVVDEVLNNGHGFYEHIIAASSNLRPRYLGNWELPPAIELNNEAVNLVYYTDIFSALAV
jgi:hypothetical protein